MQGCEIKGENKKKWHDLLFVKQIDIKNNKTWLLKAKCGKNVEVSFSTLSNSYK